MARDDRFVKIYSQGKFSGYAGGLTPLLNRDGNPIVTRTVTGEWDG